MIDKYFFYPRKNDKLFSGLWEGSEVVLNINQQQLHGWLVRAADFENAPVIIYYGGNAEDISQSLTYTDKPRSESVLFMNYRGFGGSSGRPNQEGLFADALAIYDHLVKNLGIKPDRIYLKGRSIGSSIAAYVASQRKIRGLILITPFDSIANFVPKFLQFYPLKNYLKRFFNTFEYLKNVDKKILVIAAGCDEVIPRRCLDNLLDKYRSQIILEEIQDADHQDIAIYNEYDDAIEKYIHSMETKNSSEI